VRPEIREKVGNDAGARAIRRSAGHAGKRRWALQRKRHAKPEIFNTDNHLSAVRARGRPVPPGKGALLSPHGDSLFARPRGIPGKTWKTPMSPIGDNLRRQANPVGQAPGNQR